MTTVKSVNTVKTGKTGEAFLRAGAACALGALAMLAGGCDNNHLLGAVDGGPPPTDDSGLPPQIDASPDLSHPVSAAQSWTGYVDNYTFPSGSDAVKIAFGADPAGQVTGVVILGNGTPPPPAVDPSVGYPPGYGTQQPVVVGAPSYVAEGAPYTMHDATLTGRRLRFSVALLDLWHDWCALQTPIAGSSGCLPNWGGMYSPGMGCAQTDPATGQVVPVDCGKFNLCQLAMVCLCDASGCHVQGSGTSIMFDLTINNDLADGSMDNQSVHFRKDP